MVQLYIRDRVASVSRPVLQLKGFDKRMIRVGETQTVKFTLTKEALSFYNNSGELVFEPGEFDISVGTNAAELLTRQLEVK